ncbi:MAG: phage tail spike protein [Bacilli bacterium]
MAGKRYEVRNTAKLEVVIIINLYSKTETNFNHNGLCILQPIEAVVTEELNGDYSLKLTMPRGSQLIENEQIIKVPTPKSSQPFRVYNFDVDMLGNPVFYCRHIFYDLLDYFIEDTRPSGSGALAILRILENTPFTGTSDITNQGSANYQMMSPVKAILGADNAFIEVWGGELERDNFNIKMKNHIGEDRGVSIRYRKNLTGLRFVTDLSGVATKIMPTGLKADGQTLLKLPEKYVESPLIGNYVNEKVTRIHYSDIKIDEEISESQALEALRNAAQQEFENGLDKPKITATVEFIPLQDTEEYKDFAVLENVYLGDTVKIFHEDLDIELTAKVISYEFDALSGRYNKVILGNANPKYGDIQKQYVKQQKEETTTALEQAIINATQLITGNSGGYIVMHPAEKPQEIFIMDTPDMNSAQRVWRWNLSGLGYSSTGINGPFALAMTMDGAIVADFITAGTINGALIKAGSIEAGSLSQEYKKSVTDSINGVETSVTQAFKAADGELSSTINKEISRAKGVEETLSSSISQNASNITLKVSKGDVSSQISAESDKITISSNRLSISSTYFTLSSSGKITCTSADISGTLETGGTYGYVKLSNGRLIGGNSSGESGYISFNHQVDGNPGPRLAGTNGLVIATPKFGVADYLGPGTSGTYYQGQSASQTFVTNISDNGDGTISWNTRTITFTKGLMTTSL